MQFKAVHDRRTVAGAPASVSGECAKRIDLIVTDDVFPSAPASSDATAELHQRVFCTIPLALLNSNISNETLREAARVCRSTTRDPISSAEFLHLVENLIGSLHPPQQPAPLSTGCETDRSRIERLTPRERQVLQHVVAGNPNKRTAAALNISRRTVEHHRAAIMQKTRTKSVSELVRLALRTGLCGAVEELDG